MDKKAIRWILRQADKRKVKEMLSLVNLSHMEKKIIKLVEIKRYTEEEVAEKLEVSRNTIQNYKKSAFDKINKIWSELGGN